MNEYQLTIRLKSNLHIGSGFGFAQIIDNTTIKDSEGLVYIPGSTIKGKLRSICRKIAVTLDEDKYKPQDGSNVCDGGRSTGTPICKTELESACIICRLFGSVFQEGKLIFTDAKLSSPHPLTIRVLLSVNRFSTAQTETRAGVKLSRLRRTAEAQQLFNSENISHTLEFCGQILAKTDLDKYKGKLDKDKGEEELLKWGLKTLTHLGGQKARGLGRVEISCPELDDPKSEDILQ